MIRRSIRAFARSGRHPDGRGLLRHAQRRAHAAGRPRGDARRERALGLRAPRAVPRGRRRRSARVSDSLRAVNAFLVRFATDVSRFQGDLSINMHTFGQQLLTIQELMGQSAEAAAGSQGASSSGRRPSSRPRPSRPSAAGSCQGDRRRSAPQPGPDQLFAVGQAQMTQRGSYAVARSAFQDFLDAVPDQRPRGRGAVRASRAATTSRATPRRRTPCTRSCVEQVSEGGLRGERALQARDDGEAGEPDRQGAGVLPADPRSLSRSRPRRSSRRTPSRNSSRSRDPGAPREAARPRGRPPGTRSRGHLRRNAVPRSPRGTALAHPEEPARDRDRLRVHVLAVHGVRARRHRHRDQADRAVPARHSTSSTRTRSSRSRCSCRRRASWRS